VARPSRRTRVRQVGVDRSEVEVAWNAAIRHQRAQLRGETDCAVSQRVEQGLLADAIAGEQQLATPPIPDREREHPVQTADTVNAELLVQVHDHLGVAVGGKAVAPAYEVCAQLPEVVDLAVQHDSDGAVLAEDRLVSGEEIDDAQALDPEARVAVHEQPSRVRAAMLQRRAHPLQGETVGLHLGLAHLSDDSAHDSPHQRSAGRQTFENSVDRADRPRACRLDGSCPDRIWPESSPSSPR
jgi:hypothetical protein